MNNVSVHPGSGRIHLALHGNEAVFTELSYSYPLKLLSPRVHEPCSAIAYMLSYGGGLISGDHIDLTIEVDPNASLLVLTQGATKVFKHRPGTRLSHGSGSQTPAANDVATVQKLHARIKSYGMLLLIPDPVTCFSSASFHQHQTFHLEQGASAVLLDWITSGRMSRGEEWDFLRYHSINEVWECGKRIVRDAVLLEAVEDGRLLKERMRSYSCYATIFIAGPKCATLTAELAQIYDEESVYQHSKNPSFLWSLSRTENGSVVRIAGADTETVKMWIKDKLRHLGVHVGADVLNKALI